MAADITTALPAGMDIPRINAILRRTPTGAPLSATIGTETTINIQAFFDTGASGLLLSDQTATLLGVQKLRHPDPVNSPPASFFDIGVGGAEEFGISEALYVGINNFHDTAVTENPAAYTQQIGPVRLQLAKPATNPLLDGLDVFGMPLFQGKVVVIDPRPADPAANPIPGYMRTFVYEPGTPFNSTTQTTDPGIPTVSRQVKLSYGDFTPFTSVNPSGAPGPTLVHNPFFGPDPTLALQSNPPVDNTPPVTLQWNGRSTTGSLLLDTGASASMISTTIAASLAIRYRAGTLGTENPKLESFDPANPSAPGTLVPDQFPLAIGGIGGTKTIAGFFLDTLLLQTEQGNSQDLNDPNHIRYRGAPVLVNDISLLNPLTNQSLVLDGLIGTNLLGSSAFIDLKNLINPFQGLADGPFEWLVFDEPAGKLGLQLKSEYESPQWRGTTSGDWNLAENWTDNQIPDGTTAEAFLGRTGLNTTVDLGINNRTVAALRFEQLSGTYTVSGTGGGKLIFESTTGPALLTNLVTNTGANNIAATVEVRGTLRVLAESAPITISGPMTMQTGAALNIKTGNLRLLPTNSNNSTVGTGVTAVIDNGATLTIGGAAKALASSINVTNNGQFAVESGTVTQDVGTLTGSGKTTINNGGKLTVNKLEQTGLSLNGNAQLTTNANGLAGGMSVITNSVPGDFTIATTAKWDLKNNDLVVRDTNLVNSQTTYAQVKARVLSAVGGVGTPGLDDPGENWNGPGITSSLAFQTDLTGLGYVQNNTFESTDLNDRIVKNLNGLELGFNETVVRYTYLGDANLDGLVNAADYDLFLAGLGAASSDWIFGDWNYDGVTNSADYDLFLGNLGNPVLLSNNGEGGIQAIPEPSGFAIGALAALGLGIAGLRRRRAK